MEFWRSCLKTLLFVAILLVSSWGWALPLLRVAFSLDKPPYVIHETSSGLEVELLRRVFLDMGYEMIPVFQPPARSVRSLELGRVAAMATITNMPKFHLSDSYITFQNFAWTLKSKSFRLNALSDLGKRSVIAFQNARYFLGPEFSAAISKSSDYQEYAEQRRQIKMLMMDRVDVIICEERTFRMNQEILRKASNQPLPEVEKHALFEKSQYSVAFRDKKMRDLFNKSLKRIRENGDLKVVFNRYAD